MKKIIIVISVLIALALSISCAALPTNNPEILAPFMGEWTEKPIEDGVKLILEQNTFTFKAPEGKNSSIHGTFMSGNYSYIPGSKTFVFNVEKAINSDGRLVELEKGHSITLERNFVIHPEGSIAIIGGYRGGDPETLVGKWIQTDEYKEYFKVAGMKFGLISQGFIIDFKKDGEVTLIY